MSHLMSRGQLAAAAITIAATLPLLTACTGDGDDPASADPTADSTLAADSTIDIDDTGDPFCDLAIENLNVSLQVDETTAGINELIAGVATDTTDVAALNAWGAELAPLVEESIGFYEAATPYVEGDPAAASFTAMHGFLTDYSLVLAQLAQNATSNDGFVADMQALVTTPETLAMIQAAPTAAGEVRTYIEDRCDVVG